MNFLQLSAVLAVFLLSIVYVQAAPVQDNKQEEMVDLAELAAERALLEELRDKYLQEKALEAEESSGGHPGAPLPMEKRAQTFVRFGKRAQTFVRFGKRAQTFVRFG